MIKLNKYQAKALKVVTPFDGEPNFMDLLESGKVNMHGLSFDQLSICLEELKHKGLVLLITNENEDDLTIRLSSEALSYSSSRKTEIAKTFGKYAFQFLVGTSGGLAAYLLTTLLT